MLVSDNSGRVVGVGASQRDDVSTRTETIKEGRFAVRWTCILIATTLVSGCVISSSPQSSGYVTKEDGVLTLHTVCNVPIRVVSIVPPGQRADLLWRIEGRGPLKTQVQIGIANDGYVETARQFDWPDRISVLFEKTGGPGAGGGFSFRPSDLTPGLAATGRGVVAVELVANKPDFLGLSPCEPKASPVDNQPNS